MFAVIYRFKLRPEQELIYKECWHKVTKYFIEHCGAIGSTLHKGEDHLWVAYSRWPNKTARDSAWPGDAAPSTEFPKEIYVAIKQMQALKIENQDLEQFEEICLEVIADTTRIRSHDNIQVKLERTCGLPP